MRTLALFLVVAVPSVSLAQHKTVLDEPAMDPSFEQPVAKHLLPPSTELKVEDEKPPALLGRWYFWVGAGAALSVLAAIIGGVAVAFSHPAPPLTKADFKCGTMCDGYVNPPLR